MKKRKRGVSPVVATVLLVAMVVIIALVIFLWFRGVVKEEGTKFGKNVRLVCDDVDFDAEYSNSAGTLSIVNDGNVPIFRMKLKLEGPGGYETENLHEIASSWPEVGLNAGVAFEGDIGNALNGDEEKMILIPVLLGKTGEGEKVFTCEESYGQEFNL